ncbi:MAG: DUF59 domain-containing protein [Chlorobi bacterium]|nr:MAG: DUF59 domain-containing protein [Bacteroidota bacterium]MBE2266546.1 SufE family protein [Flavobacteriales bacterium]MBL1162085.1 DUF59 domain-containing protein [Chlorobiota bacterium]MBW7854605.1 SufE family protein [Candidatus Kapabacteria bacterium]MCC6330606.1 SufE family protein [Ignavibacteria bacterium]
MSYKEAIAELQAEFDALTDWEDRYAHIIDMGKKLEPYPNEHKTDAYKIKGCTSMAWLFPHFDGERLQFTADSDAIIVKGLMALVLRVYGNCTPGEILDIQPTFIGDLGLEAHLSPSRANGLVAFIKQISLYALAYNGKEEQMQRAREQRSDQDEELRNGVIDALHTVFDPEIPVDVYELGLIYGVTIQPGQKVHILMTLTTPNCPSGAIIPQDVDQAVRNVPGVKDVEVELTFDPPWDKSKMSEAALFSIGLF